MLQPPELKKREPLSSRAQRGTNISTFDEIHIPNEVRDLKLFSFVFIDKFNIVVKKNSLIIMSLRSLTSFGMFVSS